MDHVHLFKEWFENARELGRFLGNAFYTDRVVHHCLNKPGAERIKEGVQKSIPQPYEKRFGSLMDLLYQVLPLRGGLQHFVRADVFKGGQQPGDGDDEMKVDVETAVKSIQSNDF